MSSTITETQPTGVFELRPLDSKGQPQPAVLPRQKLDGPEEHQSRTGSPLGVLDGEPPAHAQAETERWNYPRKNIGKLGFAFLSFIIAGMNDAAVGVRPPISLRPHPY